MKPVHPEKASSPIVFTLFGITRSPVSPRQSIKAEFFILVILLSSFIKPSILWNLCDYFIAILVIINVSSIIKICKKERDL